MKDITCAQAAELMTDYIDGTLDPQGRADFLAHMEQCSDCKEKADQLSFLVNSLRDIPQVPVPDGFDARLSQALKAEKTVVPFAAAKADKKPAKRRWKAMSAVAAVLLVGVVSLTMFEDGLGSNISNFFQNKEVASGMEERLVGTDSAADSGACDAEKSADTNQEKDALPEGSDASAHQNMPSDGAAAAGQAAGGSNSAVSSASQEKKEEALPNAKMSLKAKEEFPEYGMSEGAAMDDYDDVMLRSAAYLMNDVPVEEMSESVSDAALGASGGALSRGGGTYMDLQKFNTESRLWANSFAAAIEKKDSANFADVIAKVGINGYTTDTAVSVLKWYQDYLGEGKLHVEFLKNESQSMERVYRIEGSKNSTRVTVSGTAAGIRVQNALLDRGVWLAQNAPAEEYALSGVTVKNGGTEVHFRFTLEGSGASTDGEDDTSLNLPMEKEIIWKKTELSL